MFQNHPKTGRTLSCLHPFWGDFTHVWGEHLSPNIWLLFPPNFGVIHPLLGRKHPAGIKGAEIFILDSETFRTLDKRSRNW